MKPRRIGREVMLMEVAHLISKRGTCERAQVGVVIAIEGRILVTGYNGAPAGMEHCDHSAEKVEILGDRGIIVESYTGGGCKTAVHAEANAIAWAARHGISLSQADLFTTMAPCLPCAQIIVNAGIRRVIYDRNYRDETGLQLLSDANLEVQRNGWPET